MVPARFETVLVLPRLTSGKIDRKALRVLPLATPARPPTVNPTPPKATRKKPYSGPAALFPGQPLLRSADFFADLGGHSLLAARLVSLLRADTRFASVTVHDIYRERSMGGIAAALAQQEVAMPAEAVAPVIVTTPRLRRVLCSLAQAATLPPMVCLRMAQWLSPFFTYHYFTGDEGDSMLVRHSRRPAGLPAGQHWQLPLRHRRQVAGTRRAKPGRYPLWGVMYFRWWLADRIAEMPPRHLLSGSSLNAMYLRALGAKIGKDVIIGALPVRAPDLLRHRRWCIYWIIG